MNDIDLKQILYQQRALSNSIATTMNVEPEISPDDMLFDFLVRNVFPDDHPRAIEAYFNGGADCAQRFAALCREEIKSAPNSVLEFASGYGRVTRHVRNIFPKVSWTCSDVHPRAVEFARDRLGFNAFLSTPRPPEWTVTQKFAVVFALSFFSHIPHSTFGPWLERLLNAVAPNGLFIFTTHGAVTSATCRQRA